VKNEAAKKCLRFGVRVDADLRYEDMTRPEKVAALFDALLGGCERSQRCSDARTERCSDPLFWL